MRRIRTRLPTYLSTGSGALIDISNSPCDRARAEADEVDRVSWTNTVKSCLESRKIADNLSSGFDRIVPSNDRMRSAAAICQLVEFVVRIFSSGFRKSSANPQGSQHATVTELASQGVGE
jgi:hypothetical protein